MRKELLKQIINNLGEIQNDSSVTLEFEGHLLFKYTPAEILFLLLNATDFLYKTNDSEMRGHFLNSVKYIPKVDLVKSTDDDRFDPSNHRNGKFGCLSKHLLMDKKLIKDMKELYLHNSFYRNPSIYKDDIANGYSALHWAVLLLIDEELDYIVSDKVKTHKPVFSNQGIQYSFLDKIDCCIKEDNYSPVVLFGPYGIGKTTTILEYMRRRNTRRMDRIYRIDCAYKSWRDSIESIKTAQDLFWDKEYKGTELENPYKDADRYGLNMARLGGQKRRYKDIQAVFFDNVAIEYLKDYTDKIRETSWDFKVFIIVDSGSSVENTKDARIVPFPKYGIETLAEIFKNTLRYRYGRKNGEELTISQEECSLIDRVCCVVNGNVVLLQMLSKYYGQLRKKRTSDAELFLDLVANNEDVLNEYRADKRFKLKDNNISLIEHVRHHFLKQLLPIHKVRLLLLSALNGMALPKKFLEGSLSFDESEFELWESEAVIHIENETVWIIVHPLLTEMLFPLIKYTKFDSPIQLSESEELDFRNISHQLICIMERMGKKTINSGVFASIICKISERIYNILLLLQRRHSNLSPTITTELISLIQFYLMYFGRYKLYYEFNERIERRRKVINDLDVTEEQTAIKNMYEEMLLYSGEKTENDPTGIEPPKGVIDFLDDSMSLLTKNMLNSNNFIYMNALQEISLYWLIKKLKERFLRMYAAIINGKDELYEIAKNGFLQKFIAAYKVGGDDVSMIFSSAVKMLSLEEYSSIYITNDMLPYCEMTEKEYHLQLQRMIYLFLAIFYECHNKRVLPQTAYYSLMTIMDWISFASLHIFYDYPRGIHFILQEVFSIYLSIRIYWNYRYNTITRIDNALKISQKAKHYRYGKVLKTKMLSLEQRRKIYGSTFDASCGGLTLLKCRVKKVTRIPCSIEDWSICNGLSFSYNEMVEFVKKITG